MKRVLIGAGGHAREVISQIGESLPMYVDDNYLTSDTLPISELDFINCEIMIAIADSVKRKAIVDKLPLNAKYFTFIHPTALILDSNIIIGNGSFIGAYSVITTKIIIGKHSILNRMNSIGHDSIIGDYLSMMPGSIISGNCIIGNCVYLGNNSSIREKLTICDNVVIGLNSGVVKNICEQGVYGKVPAMKIK